MTVEAREQWEKIVEPLINCGIYTVIDETALILYCETYVSWVEAMTHIQTEGSILKTDKGYAYQNPWLQIANKKFEPLHKMLSEFGMTPSSRSKVKAVKGKKDSDGWNDL